MPEAITSTQYWIDFFRTFGPLIFGIMFELIIILELVEYKRRFKK